MKNTNLQKLNNAGLFYRKQLVTNLKTTPYFLNKFIKENNIQAKGFSYIQGGWHAKQDMLEFYDINDFKDMALKLHYVFKSKGKREHLAKYKKEIAAEYNAQLN